MTKRLRPSLGKTTQVATAKSRKSMKELKRNAEYMDQQTKSDTDSVSNQCKDEVRNEYTQEQSDLFDSSFPFNIGGKSFQVSRDLLDKYPESMMLRVVAELWEQERKTSKVKSIFIDRDGDRFVYVLDYMRNGSVTLPITVSKDSFLSDLNYYNIGDPQENAVQVKEQIFRGLAFGLQLHDEKITKLDCEISYLNMVKECRMIAKSALEYFFQILDVTEHTYCAVSTEMLEYVESHTEFFDELKRLFAEYGLDIVSDSIAEDLEVKLLSG